MKSPRELKAWNEAEILMNGELDATSLADILQRRMFFARLDKSETVEVPLKIAKQIVSQLWNVKLPNHRPKMRFIERSERESLVIAGTAVTEPTSGAIGLQTISAGRPTRAIFCNFIQL
jgi:hypothetical protein